MATKNNPGAFNCYDNAHPDEPMFVLLGRDKDAPALVEAWADERQEAGEYAHVVEDARLCAQQMRDWRECYYCKEPFKPDTACPGRDDPGGPCRRVVDVEACTSGDDPEPEEVDGDA